MYEEASGHVGVMNGLACNIVTIGWWLVAVMSRHKFYISTFLHQMAPFVSDDGDAINMETLSANYFHKMES